MNASRNLIRVVSRNQRVAQSKSKLAQGNFNARSWYMFPCVGWPFACRSVHHWRSRGQPFHHSWLGSGVTPIQPRVTIQCHQFLQYMSSNTSGVGTGGNDGNSDSGSKKGSGGDQEGGPVCPRCKEPFADTLSAISESIKFLCSSNDA